MIHPEIRKLIQEIYTRYDERDGERAGKYPEVYLVSLLEQIKEDLPEVSAMLDDTVDFARFGSDSEGFRKMKVRVQASAEEPPLSVTKKSRSAAKRRQMATT